MELLTNPQKLAAYREQAAALTAQMTLEEKVSQTLYNAPAIPRLGIPAYTGGTRRFTVLPARHGYRVPAGHRNGCRL